MKKISKVVIIGLDCGAPELVFERFIGDMPHVRRLMENGVWGELKSCIPAITCPAWMCMMSGLDPGELGIYGFRNRKDYSYDSLRVATSLSMNEKVIWNYLDVHKKKSIVIGCPMTYPPGSLNGYLVSGFLTPGTDCQYTYPASFKQEINEWAGGYVIDADNFQKENKELLLKKIREMTVKRFTVAGHALKKKDWEFFMMVEMGVDRIHHAFWHYMDKTHPKYQEGTKYERAIHDYYVLIDGELGKLLDIVNTDSTAVMIVSDHGAKSLIGCVCINEWLIQEGYLVLEGPKPGKIMRLNKTKINWKRTKAWGEGGYYGRIILNVKGREPEGIIPPEHYEAERDKLVGKLTKMNSPGGDSLGNVVYKPEDIYRKVNNIPPDLIVYFGNLS